MTTEVRAYLTGLQERIVAGLEAIDETGLSHGRVTAVQNFGAGDILELSKHRGHSIAVPFTKAAVPEIDFATRTLTLDSVAAGLVDDGDDEPMPDTPHVPPADRPRGPKKAGGNRWITGVVASPRGGCVHGWLRGSGQTNCRRAG